MLGVYKTKRLRLTPMWPITLRRTASYTPNKSPVWRALVFNYAGETSGLLEHLGPETTEVMDRGYWEASLQASFRRCDGLLRAKCFCLCLCCFGLCPRRQGLPPGTNGLDPLAVVAEPLRVLRRQFVDPT